MKLHHLNSLIEINRHETKIHWTSDRWPLIISTQIKNRESKYYKRRSKISARRRKCFELTLYAYTRTFCNSVTFRRNAYFVTVHEVRWSIANWQMSTFFSAVGRSRSRRVNWTVVILSRQQFRYLQLAPSIWQFHVQIS